MEYDFSLLYQQIEDFKLICQNRRPIDELSDSIGHSLYSGLNKKKTGENAGLVKNMISHSSDSDKKKSLNPDDFWDYGNSIEYVRKKVLKG